VNCYEDNTLDQILIVGMMLGAAMTVLAYTLAPHIKTLVERFKK